MKFFSEIVENVNNEILSVDEFQQYIAKLKNKLPKEVIKALTYLSNYNIYDRECVDAILCGTKSTLNSIANDHSCNIEDMVDLQKLLKGLKEDIKLLPMYMDENARKSLESGYKSIEDITLDLETEKGRSDCAKKYSKLVIAIATKYIGKSALDRNQLISAGMMGLTKAMNDYHSPDSHIDADPNINLGQKEETKKQKGLSFKQYAGWRIRQQILNDINQLSRTVRITQHEYEKNKNNGNTKGNFNTISLDMSIGDDENSLIDRFKEISEEPSVMKSDANKEFNRLYKFIESKFSMKIASQFYKFFGLNGYKPTKQVEIAKEYGVSGASVSMNVKKVIAACKSDEYAMNILRDILSIYNESLLIDNYNKSKEELMEVFISDDIYILLEEMTHWQNKSVFNNAVGSALECFEESQYDFLMDCLHNDFNFIDENYQQNRKVIIRFLEHLYPTECIKKRSDVAILNSILEISEIFKKHNLSE